MFGITAILCAAAVNCTHAGEINMPFRYPGRRYDTAAACYIRGRFFRHCPAVHPIQPIAAPPVIAPTFIFYEKI